MDMFLRKGCSKLSFKNLDLEDERNLKVMLYGSGNVDNMPKGLCPIIIQSFEAYTFWHSIHVNNEKNFYLLEDNYASNLFEVGIVHFVNNQLAKLFNRGDDDFSLANLWNYLHPKIKGTGITTQEEIDFITTQFKPPSPENSEREDYLKLTLRFRNKQVAHNDISDQVLWESYFKTFKFVFRVFAILEKKINPEVLSRPLFRKDILFNALKPYYSLKGFSDVKRESEMIRNEIIDSCSTNLVSHEKGTIKPFSPYNI